jgi:SAM-dependent methyltransferase
MHRCTSCELVFLPRPPGDKRGALFRQYFTEGARYRTIADERTHRRQARTAEEDRQARGLGRPLLDIGCAAGFFLTRLVETVGVCRVRAQRVCARARSQNLGLDVAGRGFSPTFAPRPQSFDVITLFNVLEHIPDRPASPALHAVAPGATSSSRPGPELVARAPPRFAMADLRAPHGAHCFTKRTLGRLFEPGRWTPISYRPSMKWISLDHGLSLLEYEAEHTPAVRVLKPIMSAVRRSFLGSLDVPYCLGDLAVASFRRESPDAFRLEWNGSASRFRPEVRPPGITA